MAPRNDLTNQTFHILTVLGYTGKKNKYRETIYLCKCRCGNFTELSSKSLISGNTRSCGCLGLLTKHANSLCLANDITGQKFGKLTVLKQTFDHLGKRLVRRRARFLCKCECGNEKIFVGNDLLNGKVKACGCVKKEVLKKMNENFKKQKAICKVCKKEFNKKCAIHYYCCKICSRIKEKETLKNKINNLKV